MKPIALFLTLAALAAPVFSGASDAAPKCTNWGSAYDAHIREIFNRAKQAAGVDQPVQLIGIPRATYAGSPISALPKGVEKDVDTDAIVYGFAVFDIACDDAQLATFMLHEMKHLKKGDGGKTHFDRVLACRKTMFKTWVNDPKTVLPANVDAAGAAALFDKAKGTEFQQTCVLPVEKEADQFAFATVGSLGYKLNSGRDSYQDARAQAFFNAKLWADATGEASCDAGHNCLAARGDDGADAAAKELEAKRLDQERTRLQSIDPSTFFK